MQWRRVDGTPKEQHMEMQRLTQLGTGLEHLYGGGEGHAVGLLDLTALEWELLQKRSQDLFDFLREAAQ